MNPIQALLIALLVLFTGLKLTGNIDWSWLWVVSPLWFGFAWYAFFKAAAMLCFWIARKLETPEQRLARKLREIARQIR